MLGLIGKKLGHTRVYNAEGEITPVTVVWVGKNRVLQVKTTENDGYNAVQLGFGYQKPQRLSKPRAGHLKKFGVSLDGKEPVSGVRRVRELRDFSKEVKPGDELGPDLFDAGDHVDCIGLTKGRGFEGVVKRHNFGGGDASHGAKGWHRRAGSIAPGSTPGWVDKGKDMPGHMGQVRRTVQNLEVVQVRADDGLLLIKGSMPGAEGDYVMIRESKKRPKGWVKPALRDKGKAGGKKK